MYSRSSTRLLQGLRGLTGLGRKTGGEQGYHKVAAGVLYCISGPCPHVLRMHSKQSVCCADGAREAIQPPCQRRLPNVSANVSVSTVLPRSPPIVHTEAQGWFPGPRNTYLRVLMHSGAFANLWYVEIFEGKISRRSLTGSLFQMYRVGS